MQQTVLIKTETFWALRVSDRPPSRCPLWADDFVSKIFWPVPSTDRSRSSNGLGLDGSVYVCIYVSLSEGRLRSSLTGRSAPLLCQREAVTFMPSCSGAGNVVVA
jgi:hypothetical protein